MLGSLAPHVGTHNERVVGIGVRALPYGEYNPRKFERPKSCRSKADDFE
jgi:hypothetical protein